MSTVSCDVVARLASEHVNIFLVPVRVAVLCYCWRPGAAEEERCLLGTFSRLWGHFFMDLYVTSITCFPIKVSYWQATPLGEFATDLFFTRKSLKPPNCCFFSTGFLIRKETRWQTNSLPKRLHKLTHLHSCWLSFWEYLPERKKGSSVFTQGCFDLTHGLKPVTFLVTRLSPDCWL